MHYFKRNIGEYHKKAGKLNMLQHGAYTLLMDACYDREKFPTLDEAIDWCWASSAEEIAAVEFVLRKFFTLINGVYVQNRISEEIQQYHDKALINKEIAINREQAKRDKKARTVVEAYTNEHESAPKQEPLNINQETDNNILVPSERERVPAKEIIELFNNVFTELPEVRLINEKRLQSVRSRWKETEKLRSIDQWEKFFVWIKQSDFLMGRDKAEFKLSFDWIFKAANFAKIYEGNYHK